MSCSAQAISPRGPPADVIRAWESESFVWIVSDDLLDELVRAFAYPRVMRYLAWNQEHIADFLGTLRRRAVLVSSPQNITAIPEDPSDNRFLEAALAGQADYIVSGDRALLALAQFEGVEIIRPARFVAILRDTAR
jgi:putative PIN family toxin of toxin-antitoxin system